MKLFLLSTWLQDMHFLYVLAAANLYAQMHGLPGSRDETSFRELLELLPKPESMHPDLISDGTFAPAEFGDVIVLYSHPRLAPCP